MKYPLRSGIRGLSVLLVLLCLLPALKGQDVVDRIPLMPGPEDMVLDTLHGDPALLISCCARRDSHKPYGEILKYNLKTGNQEVLERKNEAEEILFRPHGIYMDADLLYVISHEREPDYHPVLVYRIEGDHLEFLELIHTDGQHSPNALVTGPNGEIYLANDSGKRGSMLEKALKLKRASVVKIQKNPQGTWQAETVADKLGYPAGINRTGDQIYVGDAVLHRIHVYRIEGGGLSPAGEISKLKGNDNIRIYQGQLLTPGHVKVLKFIKHAKKSEKKSPVDVYLADPSTGQVTTIFSTDGSAISAGSTAIIYNHCLYICQIFDPFILKVELEN